MVSGPQSRHESSSPMAAEMTELLPEPTAPTTATSSPLLTCIPTEHVRHTPQGQQQALGELKKMMG